MSKLGDGADDDHVDQLQSDDDEQGREVDLAYAREGNLAPYGVKDGLGDLPDHAYGLIVGVDTEPRQDAGDHHDQYVGADKHVQYRGHGVENVGHNEQDGLRSL